MKQQLDSLDRGGAGLRDGRRAARDEEVLREPQALGLRASLATPRHLNSLLSLLVWSHFTDPKMALDRGLAEPCYSSALLNCLYLTEYGFRHRPPCQLESPPVPQKSPQGVTMVTASRYQPYSAPKAYARLQQHSYLKPRNDQQYVCV